MAESVVSYFAAKLGTLITDEGNLLLGVEEQLLLLQSEFEFIKSFLRDAERKRRKSHLVEVWVTQIRDIAYHTEDVIDAYILHQEQRKNMNLFKKIFYSGKKLETLHKIGKQIEQINTRTRRISSCRLDYNIDVAESTTIPDVAQIRDNIQIAEEIDVVGFQEESDRIVNLLKEQVPQRRVISIIGMGGLGKTSLARKIYKLCHAPNWFDIQIWITVSQQHQVRDILLNALNQVSIYSSGLESKANEELKRELCEQLTIGKYIVVIDDIWKVEAWDHISGAFPNTENGSRVILTTRNKEVALHADPSTANHIGLGLLNEEHSLELFCKKVFQLPVADCPSELVRLGMEIVEKCGGLPFAILVIGGLLMGKARTPDAWSKVAESVSWYLSQDSNKCHQILTLSYSDLPDCLKPCFLYLGLYPEDSKIDAGKLIRLWVAEGFLEARRHVSMEDVADDYLEELVQRSLVQVSKRAYHGGPVQYLRVHDLLRDLAITEGRKDRFTEIHNNNNSYILSTTTTRPRRLAIHPATTSCSQGNFCTPIPPNLRSLIFFQEKYTMPTFSNSNKMLRVLDLQSANISKGLPKEIGKLLFLHYLRLAHTEVKSLPSSIGNLVKLQTLDIRSTCIKVLPKSIWNLKNLRHFIVNRDCKRMEGIAGAKDFGRDLRKLVVPESIWMNNDGTGLLNILVERGCLLSLEVINKLAVDYDAKHLRNCFPPTLTELILTDSLTEEDPSEVLGRLPKLKALYLIGFNPAKRNFKDSKTGRAMVFRAGGFPQLQYLHLAYFELSEWQVEDGSMPILRHLKIGCLLNLKRLSGGLRKVTTLQKIEVFHMGDLEAKIIRRKGENWDIVKHIPYLTINGIPAAAFNAAERVEDDNIHQISSSQFS